MRWNCREIVAAVHASSQSITGRLMQNTAEAVLWGRSLDDDTGQEMSIKGLGYQFPVVIGVSEGGVG